MYIHIGVPFSKHVCLESSNEPWFHWNQWNNDAADEIQPEDGSSPSQNCSCFHNIRPPITNLRFLGNEYLGLRIGSPSCKMTATSKMLSLGNLGGPLAAPWEEHPNKYSTVYLVRGVVILLAINFMLPRCQVRHTEHVLEQLVNNLHGMDGLISV